MSFSSSPISQNFVDSLTVVTTTLDGHGQRVYSGQYQVFGRLLEHVSVYVNDRNEESQTDAIVHLPPDTPIKQYDILKCDATGEFYRVEKFIRAKRLKSTTIVFIKGYLAKEKSFKGVS